MLDGVTLNADLCVVGGGMAGLCAALAAARCGARVALMHERPVLGGNASSECRVHITGAGCHGTRPDARETGIVEELQLRNLHVNPQRSYSVWDTVLWEAARAEPNLDLLLNCSCSEACKDGDRIARLAGWQMTTQKRVQVEADYFADCTGDGVTALLAGAEARVGREGREEFGESLAPEHPDDRTMGMTCLFMARPTDRPQPFQPPSWVRRFDKPQDLAHRRPGRLQCGYWWIELGGDRDAIGDTEDVRDELLPIVYGIWDHLKNRGDYGAENWVLDWVQFLPAKRESRRLVGDHLLCQGDIVAGGPFGDTVAYGGWPMDQHPPAGLWDPGPPADFGEVPDIYGIPLRSLYSRNVANLWMAGRDASCTHVGLSSSRVMGTCALMGQAVGTAAAYAARRGLTPRECAESSAIDAIQQRLLADDCYLPGRARRFGRDTSEAALTASRGAPEPLRDGVNRQVRGTDHSWRGRPGDWVEYRWGSPREVRSVALAFDSNLSVPISLSYHTDSHRERTPPELVKRFSVLAETDGSWREVYTDGGNYLRFRRVELGDLRARAVRLVAHETHGADDVRVFTLAVNEPSPAEFPARA
jgi:hypothetical protein